MTFDGNKKHLQNFLYVMQNFIDTVGLGDGSRACRYFVSFLRGEALTWWRSFSNDDLRIFDHMTLDVLLTEIKSHFSDIDSKMKLREKLFNLRQVASVTRFTQEFKRLQLDLGNSRMTDDVAIHLYLHGLKPEIQKWVMMARPDTFGDACLLAECADAAQASTSHGQPSRPQYQPNRQPFRNQQRSQNQQRP